MNFARNYEKHQMLGWWVIRPSDPATQHIILKIVGFLINWRSLEKCQIIEIMHESYVRLVLSMIKYIKSACRHWNVKMKVKVRKRLIQGHLSISTSQCAFTKLPYIRRISMQFVAKKLNTCKYGTKIYWLDSLLLTPIYTIDFWHSLVWNF